MKKWLTFLGADSAALLLGISLAFAFAPYEIFPLAFIAPAGLLALWLYASPIRAFKLGFLFGLGLFGAGVYWIFHSIHYFGDVPTALSVLFTSILIAILALFPACVGYLLNRYFQVLNDSKILCAFPALWVIVEWIRSWLFTGFAWLFLGYSQTNSPLKGYAPILSVYGVSLAVAMTSALIVSGIMHFRRKNFQSAYLNLFAIVAIWLTGGLLNLIPWTHPLGKSLSLSLVQGNIPQELKWNPDHLKLSFDRYEALTKPLWGKSDFIIWPEAAIPMPLQQAAPFIEVMDMKAKKSGSQLILGIPTEAENGRSYHNAVLVLGKNQQFYYKRRLVPFGEYVPFQQLFSHIFNYLNIPMSDLTPGQWGQDPIHIGNIKILTSICYEITYPELTKSTDSTISFILTVTNDAWFGDSSAQAQHLQMAEMRAIELRRPVVFVSNDGITAIINANGNIQAAAPPHQAVVLKGSVQPMSGLTPWMRNGMNSILFILLCLIITAVRGTRKLPLTAALTIKENKRAEENNDTSLLQP